MIGYAKKIEKIIRESAFDKKKKKPGLKFNLGLALNRVRTTGPWSFVYVVLQVAVPYKKDTTIETVFKG